MTPDEIKKIPDLCDIATDADDACVELERIQYMLQILDEGLAREVGFLNTYDDHAQYFVSRYDMYRAQLETVELWLYKTREDLEKLPGAIRSHCGKEEVAV